MIKFGPAGNCENFYSDGLKSTLQTPKWLRDKGLNAFEYSFGKGYLLSNETAIKIGEEFANNNIALSLHAPYFINFANPSEEMFEKSKNYIKTGIRYLKLMQAKRLIFHPASCGKMPRKEAFELTKKRLQDFVQELEEENLLDGIWLCPETMGKSLQIGTFEEIIELCSINQHLLPTFDFGHINALTQGGLKSADDYQKIIDLCFEKLGRERTEQCHIHFSKIEYGAKGEIRHLTFEDKMFGPYFEDFCEVLIKNNLKPTIICESNGTQDVDALFMKNYYLKNL